MVLPKNPRYGDVEADAFYIIKSGEFTFSLPSSTRTQRQWLLVRDQIRPMRLKANVGITTGTVFIGYVGAESRGEYTEYGVMVNMAAMMIRGLGEILQQTRNLAVCWKPMAERALRERGKLAEVEVEIASWTAK